MISWLVLLSIIIFRLQGHYNRLISQTGEKTLDEIIDRLLSRLVTVENQEKKTESELNDLIQRVNKGHNKIGFYRFHAFGKSEGEQSFVIAFLNDYHEGMVLTFMHIHEGIRIYAKPVSMAKDAKIKLSEEEQKAIELAT